MPLALTPTPLQEAPRLAKELGIGRLLIKRDDLTGLAFGGNKTRNLEFRMAEAVELGTEVFIAGLEAQSNSARQTTAAANILGMQTILVLRTDRDWGWQGNPLIDRILGADVRWLETDDPAVMDQTLRDVAEEQRAAGQAAVRHEPRRGVRARVGAGVPALHRRDRRADGRARRPADPPLHDLGNKGHAGLVIGRKLLGQTFRTVAISQRRGDDRVPGALAGARDAARTLGWDVPLSEARRRELRRVRRRGLRRADPGSAGRHQAGRPHRGAAAGPGLHRQGDGRPDRPRPARPARARTTSVVFIHTGGLPALFAFKDEILNDRL